MKAMFLGGDLRQHYACEYLKMNGIDSEFCSDINFDEKTICSIQNASIVVLPIPISKDKKHINNSLIKISDLIAMINDHTTIFGGQFYHSLRDYLYAQNKEYIDYFDIESFQIQNALLTAEGAIYYAKQRMNRSIHGSEIAILGFGRIGKILAYLLHSQGAKITVCARKDSDFTWSKLIGFNGVKIKISGNESNLNLVNNKYDLLFNTIPFWVMDDEFAKNIYPDTAIIDLASHPFGIDEHLVKKYQLKYCRELGIPGRYAPESAGEIIGKTILNHLQIRRTE